MREYQTQPHPAIPTRMSITKPHKPLTSSTKPLAWPGASASFRVTSLDGCRPTATTPFPHDPARALRYFAKATFRTNPYGAHRKSSKINSGTRQKGRCSKRLVSPIISMPELVKNTPASLTVRRCYGFPSTIERPGTCC